MNIACCSSLILQTRSLDRVGISLHFQRSNINDRMTAQPLSLLGVEHQPDFWNGVFSAIHQPSSNLYPCQLYSSSATSAYGYSFITITAGVTSTDSVDISGAFQSIRATCEKARTSARSYEASTLRRICTHRTVPENRAPTRDGCRPRAARGSKSDVGGGQIASM